MTLAASRNAPTYNLSHSPMTDFGKMLCKAIAMSRIGRIVPSIADVTPSPVKEQVLGLLLPSLHLLTLVGVLDEGLSEYIDTQNIPWPPKTKRDLYNRIAVTATHAPALDAQSLQAIREKRNGIAHATDPAPAQPLTWSDLDAATMVLVDAFVAIGYLASRPSIEAHYTREPKLFLDQVGPSGERMRHAFRVWATVDGQQVIQYKTEITYMPLNAGR